MIVTTSNITKFLYKRVAKPFFFTLDPEFVHDTMTSTGNLLGKLPPLRELIRANWAYADAKLIKVLDGIAFPNPVGLSAGFDYNGKLTQITPAVGFGFHTIGTITFEPYQGNVSPRLGRLPKSQGLLVNKGLKNLGIPTLIPQLELLNFEIPVGISIASTNRAFTSEAAQITNILRGFKALEASRVKHSYYELNISCPNTFGGEPFTTPEKLERLLTKMDTLKLSRPMYIKMPIDQSVAETLAMMKIIHQHNAQGVIMGNLTKNHQNPAIHKDEQKIWNAHKGNVSGKPTWDLSNAHIAAIRKKYPHNLTIIGTGGVFTGADAQHKMELGADLVQLITGMIFEGPQAIGQINRHLAKNLIHTV